MQRDERSEQENILAAEDGERAEAETQELKESFVYKNMQLQKEVGFSVMQYTRRLHQNLRHPSPLVLTKMLEEIQPTKDVLKAAP